jgi:hypothetical protein
LLELAHVHPRFFRQCDGILFHQQRRAERFAQTVQRRPQNLLRGGPGRVEPKEGQQVVARDRLRVCGQ